MIKITTDRAIREKLEEIREREFEKRMIYERFEQLERRFNTLERAVEELSWKIESSEGQALNMSEVKK